ncbi:transcriptional regulator [Saccharomonospora marina XMU15]|uniref:Transcriptional regulator n=1 Tax=Saccharomonospora marina XMU15 TaxID=882083 RepID=H5WY04_9PSEU|nr:LysR family transcriptional regulator [Saccharomonospora marina]EHR52871.1 transcriptional regulator [Saccharomonospora marina XMU15]
MASLRQLEYLVAIAEQGSFTRAAEVLHVTQPALSHQVRVLERSVGGPLLERLPRAVRLTPMGRAMLPHARAALADARRASCAARQAFGLERAELELATVYSMSLGVLPPALRRWSQDYPSVHIRLHEYRHADELREGMAQGQADVAVGPQPSDWEGTVRTLGVEEFVVVVPPDFEAGESGEVELAELAGSAWVHYAPGNGLADIVDQACAAAGFRPRVSVRTEQSAAVPVLAASGLGPALVPANIVAPRFEGRVLRPRPSVRRTLAAYTRSAPDPLTAEFLRVLARECAVGPRP